MILLNVRKGTLWGILLIIVGTSTFIFWASTGDNILVNELKVRLQYSYAITYSLLTLVIVALACYTVRSQIDQRQMHMLTSFPISRREIWLGKWLGLVGIAVLGEVALFLSLTTSSYCFSRTFPEEQVASAKQFFHTIRYEARPLQDSARNLTQKRIKQLIQQKKMAPHEVNNDIRRKIFEQIRKDQQLIAPQGEKTWKFDLKGKPNYGDHVQLKFKFYTESRRNRIQGSWLIFAPGQVESFRAEFDVFPYTFNLIEIPIAQLPGNAKFNVTLKSRHTSDLIVNKKVGLKIYYEDGPFIQNVLKAFVLQIIHLGVTVSVGLMTGVAFTFSVATFLAIVLYFLSVSSGFFSGIVRDLTSGYHISLLEQLSAFVINAGMWLAKGLQPPGIIAPLTSGISIPVGELVVNWLPAIILYGTVIAFVGISLLAYKELDKLANQ